MKNLIQFTLASSCFVNLSNQLKQTTAALWFPFRINEEEDLNLGTSFSAETNRRDEDADM